MSSLHCRAFAATPARRCAPCTGSRNHAPAAPSAIHGDLLMMRNICASSSSRCALVPGVEGARNAKVRCACVARVRASVAECEELVESGDLDNFARCGLHVHELDL